jgi:hypothetical protein
MAEIINEIPDELKDEDESQEIELKDEGKEPEEVEVEAKEKSKKEVKPKQEELDFDIEIEDDTPPQDRNREPLPENIKEELEADDLEDYSERVKNRMAQLKKAWHDERRAKEAETREREEAFKMAQRYMEENKKLKKTLSTGEEDYLKTLREKYESDLAVAKKEYREAYDSGDADRMMEAQDKLSEAQFKLHNANGMKPQYSSLQEEENSVQIQENTNQQNSFKPDQKALSWQQKNVWFGKDEEMTSLALGLHEKLVRSGVNPASDEYYRRIDETMHKRFPEYFGDDTESIGEEKPQRKPSTVVAPATRSTGPKKIRLTKTQLALAKKFKLTPEQYARELIKTENANG